VAYENARGGAEKQAVDAITLSTAQLVNAGRLNAEDGWRLIVVAAISNLIFKAAPSRRSVGGNYSSRFCPHTASSLRQAY
jgi:hypothetical protein